MFLKEVYRHSRWMFAGMLFFALLQLAINYKRGMVFSPFYHYGMYSWPQPPRQFYQIRSVLLNGDTLRGKDLSPQRWDKVHYTLQQAYASTCDNSFYQEQVARLFKKAGLRAPRPVNYVNAGTVEERIATYEQWIAKQLGRPNAEVTITSAIYVYRFGRFVPVQPADPKVISNPLCK